MVADQAMSFAIGLGCRKGSSAAAIATLITDVITTLSPARPIGVFTVMDKQEEAGLASAAASLGLPLFFLSRAQLLAQSGQVQTRSAAAQRRFGLPSIAEAAALAGAGANARLILPRIALQGVTCAAASLSEISP
jgi:cobalamin biosynthesis protein CbiG